MEPDYKKIFTDILAKKYPQKQKDCKTLLDKENLSILGIIELNRIICEFTDKESHAFNQKHRSYKKSDIFKILDYQKKNNLSNIQLANHFKLSRNTVAKWNKLFFDGAN